MNKNKILVVIICIITIIGCKKKSDDETSTQPTTYKVNYMNQILQGKIGGKLWKHRSGNISTYDNSNPKYSHYFEILDSAVLDSCYFSSGHTSKVIFSIEDKNPVLSKNTYHLNFDFSDTTSKTVTLVVYEKGAPFNYIASSGGYEILSVDTVKKLVTGRMDAKYDNQNYVNGNFTLKYCSW